MRAAGATVDQRALLRSVQIDTHGDTDPKIMVSDTAYYDLLERIAWGLQAMRRTAPFSASASSVATCEALPRMKRRSRSG